MSVRLLGVVAAVSAMALVACGDDTGGAGGAGTGGTGSGGDGTTTATGSTTSGGDGGGGGDTTSSTTSGGDGGGGGDTGAGGGGGEPAAPPCAEACADDPGCDESPANVEDTGECATCVQAQADMGVGSECAAAGALGPCCAGDDPSVTTPCSEYVQCVIGQGTTCEADHPEGSERAAECVLASCGSCGTPE
jgi:hypothetical protein